MTKFEEFIDKIRKGDNEFTIVTDHNSMQFARIKRSEGNIILFESYATILNDYSYRVIYLQ